MSFALTHIFSSGEQRTRGRHERIDVTLNDPHDNDDVDLEQGMSGTSSRVNPANANASNARTNIANDTFPNEEELEDNPDIENGIMEGEGEAAANKENINPDLQRRMAELEEEQEIRRRRQSTCTIFVIFILFCLWVEALTEGDVGLLFICMMGTSSFFCMKTQKNVTLCLIKVRTNNNQPCNEILVLIIQIKNGVDLG